MVELLAGVALFAAGYGFRGAIGRELNKITPSLKAEFSAVIADAKADFAKIVADVKKV